jgi:hypothetical protein
MKQEHDTFSLIQKNCIRSDLEDAFIFISKSHFKLSAFDRIAFLRHDVEDADFTKIVGCLMGLACLLCRGGLIIFFNDCKDLLMNENLVQVYVRVNAIFVFEIQHAANIFNQIFTMMVTQHDLRIADYHHIRWYVVKNGFELLLLLADHLLVEEEVHVFFIHRIIVTFDQYRRCHPVE